MKGKAARARPPGQTRWTPLAAGEHQLAAGTAVSVPRGGSLQVTRGDERADVKGAAGGVAFPLDEVVPASAAYRWTLNHTMQVGDPLELFPLHLDEVRP